MKTSELKKIVEDNGRMFEFFESVIRILNYRSYATIGKVSLIIGKEFSIDNTCPKAIAQAILDYAYTPLEEREEEKKYWLVFPKAFNNEIEIVLGKYSNGYDCCGTEASKEKFKVKFTQKEIDEMPFDTKFFEKVEVK